MQTASQYYDLRRMSLGIPQHPYDLPYHWTWSPFLQYVVEQAVRRVESQIRGKSVLDVGCGDGFTTALLAQHARSVHGIDMNPRAIQFARLIVDRPGVSFDIGSASEIVRMAKRAFPQVEIITGFEIIEHLHDAEREAFLSAAHSLLSVYDGTLILTTPNAKRSFRRSGNPYHVAEYRAGDLVKLLERAGFCRVKVEGLYLQPPWPELEHFANVIPFRAVFRALARGGKHHPRWCRTLICQGSPGR